MACRIAFGIPKVAGPAGVGGDPRRYPVGSAFANGPGGGPPSPSANGVRPAAASLLDGAASGSSVFPAELFAAEEEGPRHRQESNPSSPRPVGQAFRVAQAGASARGPANSTATGVASRGRLGEGSSADGAALGGAGASCQALEPVCAAGPAPASGLTSHPGCDSQTGEAQCRAPGRRAETDRIASHSNACLADAGSHHHASADV